jgi:hypothetical protein
LRSAIRTSVVPINVHNGTPARGARSRNSASVMLKKRAAAAVVV